MVTDKEFFSMCIVSFPSILLDRTTGRNIIWATDNYATLGDGYGERDEITAERLLLPDGSRVVVPRVEKSLRMQKERARGKAEVFTPSWIVNDMNNVVDEAWFERKDVFNAVMSECHDWKPTEDAVCFPIGKTWRDYVNSTRLEITCGEAPFVTSRYDAVTGEPIPIRKRCGILDRKLRVVGENTTERKDWLKWAFFAVKNTYGYEYQGDNLYLARKNVMGTFCEHHEDMFHVQPPFDVLEEVADVVSWNFWQMDGLKHIVPFSDTESVVQETDLFGNVTERTVKSDGTYCIIKDWASGKMGEFRALLS